jgi:hypothetical protein
MLWEALSWITALVEVIVVATAILGAGLVIATAGFWILSRILGRIAGPQIESDSAEYEEDHGDNAALVPIPPENPSSRPPN